MKIFLKPESAEKNLLDSLHAFPYPLLRPPCLHLLCVRPRGSLPGIAGSPAVCNGRCPSRITAELSAGVLEQGLLIHH